MMKGQTSGTYSVVEDDRYELEIEYEYYWDDGDYNSPPEDELEVTDVTLNGMNITSFYMDFLGDSFQEQLYDYAQENKFN